MRITDVRVRRLPYERPYAIANALSAQPGKHGTITIVEVLTDEGITGVMSSHMFDATCRQIIATSLREQVIGQDPIDVERLWARMFGGEAKWRKPIAKGEVVRAISAIDTAAWDILGKKLNLPVYRLLGGFRDRVPCYASGGHYIHTDSLAAELEHLSWEMPQYLAMGFRAIKMRVGRDLAQDVERVKLVRSLIGPETKLLVDFNSSPSQYGGAPYALRFIRALERYDIYWFEDPLVMDDITGMKQIADCVDAAIATGEHEQTKWGFRELIATRAVDIVLPDATQMCGGITEWRKIAALAETFHIPVAAHIGDGVHTHCVAGVPNGLMVEVFMPLDPARVRHLVRPDVRPGADGMLAVSQAPGLGIELDEDYLSRHLAGSQAEAGRA